MTHTCILVVDDDESIHDLLSLTLNDEFDLLHARSGAEVPGLVLNACPDLVFLDRLLPDIDGVELCRRLKNDPATAAIPVFIVSVDGSQEARHRAFLAGADRFLVKPFSPLALRRALSNAYGSEARRPRAPGYRDSPERSM